ncbi:tripartite motif-containing protein 44 [Sinocyclocheilus anshuiensis]|uniref:Tripartite motif-containing protein 44-like n=1 Tax=Sinocyclocheilus anshuiensis TaxID=1608454 RepID=A0A671MDQ1_9TELE|nr:PREDICTED: tripartite motif-containing protein 44-like [Sinocyclocheilus anshuiensis]XP_016336973.1 PREDICTED: tripartite motif-containing protein 44-like [Sinocyclocheilus anshuiensis]XP_016336982.1 PREDICTED: tripartite motif-containing protein 44-like [Sinocyclocheilus anshuiensis]
MDASRGCWDSSFIEDDLPQMDGTCDACEPDEPQSAVWMCTLCHFAFCSSHADKHSQSTGHQLQPYSSPDPQAECGPLKDCQVSENAAEGAEATSNDEHKPAKRDTVTVERLKCKEHGQEGSLYCKHDQRIICVLCAVQGEHREHEIITLKEAYLWQKSKEGIDLLERTHEISEKIKAKWISPDMSVEELEQYVNQQFDELHRLVRLEEWRVLHLVDLKEAFLTAQAAEKITEISVHTEKLQEEMDSITQQLSELDQVEQDGVAPMSLAPLLAARPPRPPEALVEPMPLNPDLRLRAANQRRAPEDPSGDEDREDAYIGHAP